MDTARNSHDSALMSLESAAASARGGFACAFSSSDEYERALISERRAQGRYAKPKRRLPFMMLVGCALMAAGAMLLFGGRG